MFLIIFFFSKKSIVCEYVFKNLFFYIYIYIYMYEKKYPSPKVLNLQLQLFGE